MMRIRLDVEDAINLVEKHGGGIDQRPDPEPTDVEVNVTVNLTATGLLEIAQAAKAALEDAGFIINPNLP